MDIIPWIIEKERVVTLKAHVVSQFGRPHGALGRLVGFIMATRASNRARNRWTVEQLELEPNHRVLELGFGPGLALQQVAQALPTGLVVGCEHSAQMLRAATRQNRAAIAQGRMRLWRASIEDVAARRTVITGPFDRIFGVNVAMFITDWPTVFRGLATLLAPGGRLLVTHQPRMGDTSAEAAHRTAAELSQAMRAAGLSHGTIRTLARLDPPAVCVVGTQPDQRGGVQ